MTAVMFAVLNWVFHRRWLTRYRWVHDRLMRGFRRLADRGDANAQELYGFLLLHKGTDSGARATGANYLAKVAGVSRPKAAWQMYQLYRDGLTPGFAASDEKAEHYLQLAARGGHPLAEQAMAEQVSQG
ncbi:hypothetical protein BGP77_06515 [Saccharospirillum sp. MSK14-1]|uniref:hypothetical protein n=1 Tax=Saccharospirillum sp. MSK14-1 TaxID=1897632 RepID=UPI000D34151D|nr:hypothetical protein [Saccharospirillum sp. MSK14-1]PTY36934.1 hypothetical protein BGP77_06515 [Saccharospirillum sp. MSK14-1]